MRFPLIALAELDSTNSEAARRGRAGELGPVWILADRQTAGRGRLGRVWQGDPANLAVSLLLTKDRPPAETAQIAFVAALAAGDLAAAFAPPPAVTLKWPNDVLIEGAKVCGVLVETGLVEPHQIDGLNNPPFPLDGGKVGIGGGTVPQLDRRGGSSASAPPDGLHPYPQPFPHQKVEWGLRWIAVGIGANLATAPKDTPYRATSIADHGQAPTPQEALEVLDQAFVWWLETWETQGFEPVRQAWMKRAHGLGQPVSVTMSGRTVNGLIEGLDADGALLLRGDQGTLSRITAGDVIFDIA